MGDQHQKKGLKSVPEYLYQNQTPKGRKSLPLLFSKDWGKNRLGGLNVASFLRVRRDYVRISSNCERNFLAKLLNFQLGTPESCEKGGLYLGGWPTVREKGNNWWGTHFVSEKVPQEMRRGLCVEVEELWIQEQKGKHYPSRGTRRNGKKGHITSLTFLGKVCSRGV